RTQNYSLLDSDLDPDDVDNDDCTGGQFPGYLSIRNTGNRYANVTVATNYTGDEFFNNSGSWYAFKVQNHPERPGCVKATYQDTYLNFTTTDPYLACDNLSFLSLSNTFLLSVRALIYENTTSKSSASITFEARLAE
ncbi:MAG: hypothetical protein ACQESE_03055, partial [Nanobdellota archaeon]